MIRNYELNLVPFERRDLSLWKRLRFYLLSYDRMYSWNDDPNDSGGVERGALPLPLRVQLIC